MLEWFHNRSMDSLLLYMEIAMEVGIELVHRAADRPTQIRLSRLALTTAHQVSQLLIRVNFYLGST